MKPADPVTYFGFYGYLNTYFGFHKYLNRLPQPQILKNEDPITYLGFKPMSQSQFLAVPVSRQMAFALARSILVPLSSLPVRSPVILERAVVPLFRLHALTLENKYIFQKILLKNKNQGFCAISNPTVVDGAGMTMI